jgi:hypothetical protein
MANAKLAQLHNQGVSRDAFTFKSMFTPTGEKYRMDTTRVKALTQSEEK